MRLTAKLVAIVTIALTAILPGVVLAVTPNSCCVGGDCAGSCTSYAGETCDAGYTAVYCSTSGAGGGDFCCPSGNADCCNLCTPKTSAVCPAGTSGVSCTDVGLNKPCQAANVAPKGPTAPKSIPLVNPLGTNNLRSVLGIAARVMLGLAGTVALAMFVWGGITWMTSGGDPKKVEAGKRIMVWTAVGLAVMFGAEAIVRAVLSALSSGTAT